MSKNEAHLPWSYLEEFRGKDFSGEWPTFPEMLKIQVKRNGDRPFLTDFEGPKGSKQSLSYKQVLANRGICRNIFGSLV